jgi:hypothetical protein
VASEPSSVNPTRRVCPYPKYEYIGLTYLDGLAVRRVKGFLLNETADTVELERPLGDRVVIKKSILQYAQSLQFVCPHCHSLRDSEVMEDFDAKTRRYYCRTCDYSKTVPYDPQELKHPSEPKPEMPASFDIGDVGRLMEEMAGVSVDTLVHYNLHQQQGCAECEKALVQPKDREQAHFKKFLENYVGERAVEFKKQKAVP